MDLAGSEDTNRSLAAGAAKMEASFINKSLLALGRVIVALASGSPHIPYRESKLTRLLSEATATVAPDVVARGIVAGMERWAPAISVGFDGWMLSTVTAGMGPAGSLGAALLQAGTMGLWRAVALFYVQGFYSTVMKQSAAE